MTKPLLEDITDDEISDAQALHVRYMVQLISYQIMIMFQFILIISTAIKFYYIPTSKIDKKSTKQAIQMNKSVKRLFILVMVLGTVIFLLVEWYGIADFLYDFAAYNNNNTYCDIAAKLGNFSIMTFLLSLYLFFLYRLYATFNNSPFQLSKRFLTILLTVTFTVYFSMVIAVFSLQEGKTEQVWFSWSGKVQEYKWITICAGEFSIGINPALGIILEVIVVIANIFYGWLFYKKLYDLMQLMESDLDYLNKMLKLVNRQTTLVMVSTVSTTLMWTAANVAHSMNSYFQVVIYLDISTNCLCLWLMFPWNARLYRMFCKPCAFMNDLLCRKLTGSKRLRDIAETVDLSKPKTKTENNGKVHIHGSQLAQMTPQNSQKSDVSDKNQSTVSVCVDPVVSADRLKK